MICLVSLLFVDQKRLRVRQLQRALIRSETAFSKKKRQEMKRTLSSFPAEITFEIDEAYARIYFLSDR